MPGVKVNLHIASDAYNEELSALSAFLRHKFQKYTTYQFFSKFSPPSKQFPTVLASKKL